MILKAIKFKGLKDIVTYGVASFFHSLVSFAIVPFLTHNISIEDYGFIGLYQSIIYYGVHLLDLGVMALVGIKFFRLDREQYGEYRYNIYMITFITYFFWSIVLFFCIIFLKNDGYRFLVLLIPHIALVIDLNQFVKIRYVAEKKSFSYSIINSSAVALSAILTVFFVLCFGWSWKGRLMAILFGEGLIALLAHFMMFREEKFCYSLNMIYIKDMLSFGIPTIFGALGGWFLNAADKLIVLNFFSLKEVGLYSAGYSIGSVVNMINGVSTQIIMPNVYQRFTKSEKNDDKRRDSFFILKIEFFYGIFIFSIAIIIGILSFYYIGLILGKQYKNSGGITLLISMAFSFNGVYRVSALVLDYYQLAVQKTIMTFIAGALNFVISILFIFKWGYLGPALGTLISYFVLALIVTAYSCYYLRKES